MEAAVFGLFYVLNSLAGWYAKRDFYSKCWFKCLPPVFTLALAEDDTPWAAAVDRPPTAAWC